MYDDYKFVTRSELEDMNLAQLVGTNLLKAYMHGFFMDIRLYKKVHVCILSAKGLDQNDFSEHTS